VLLAVNLQIIKFQLQIKTKRSTICIHLIVVCIFETVKIADSYGSISFFYLTIRGSVHTITILGHQKRGTPGKPHKLTSRQVFNNYFLFRKGDHCLIYLVRKKIEFSVPGNNGMSNEHCSVPAKN
jgi:hypothetical protein